MRILTLSLSALLLAGCSEHMLEEDAADNMRLDVQPAGATLPPGYLDATDPNAAPPMGGQNPWENIR